jgi:hypothetical protein
MKVFTMKFCINCKHFLLSEGAPNKPELGRCAEVRPISMVTGNPLPEDSLPFASVKRMDGKGCTNQAIFFVEKAVSHV